MAIALIVLAAGKGTRMESEIPKVLHSLGNVPLLAHALASGRTMDPERTVVVVGHEGDTVAAAAHDIDPEILIATQEQQLGTGHAVQSAQQALAGFEGDVIVLYGDTPFVRPETLEAMVKARTDGADLVVLGFEVAGAHRYGRLVCEGDRLVKIVEHKDANDTERAITLCNSGVVMANAAALFSNLERISPSSASGEIYLTDLAQIVTENGGLAQVVQCDQRETLGIDSRADLMAAEEQFQADARSAAVEAGVIMQAPATVFFSQDTAIGRDALVEQYVVFGPGVTVETGARIRAFSHLEGAHVSEGAVVGPYARLRPGSELSGGARVGNFVEIKNAQIGEGAKVNHLSYVGDAQVGAQTNIGAGTVTCNYDGVLKHPTVIGERVFVGSNTMLVAPVSVGDDAMTASGSVITRDVAPGALAVARARQEEKPGLAVRIMQRLRALKAKQKD